MYIYNSDRGQYRKHVPWRRRSTIEEVDNMVMSRGCFGLENNNFKIFHEIITVVGVTYKHLIYFAFCDNTLIVYCTSYVQDVENAIILTSPQSVLVISQKR